MPPARRRVLGGAAAAGLGLTSLALPSARAATSPTRTLGAEASPATSARALLDDGWDTDGWYWIQTSSMSTPRRVWCNLTDESGGWMLVCYSPDHRTTGSRYPNVWENGEGTLDRSTVDVMDLWFHDGSAQCDSVLRMASPTAGVTPRLADVEMANRVTYSNPGDLALVPYVTSAYQITTTGALDGTWTAVKGHTVMTGPLSVNAPRDWIQVDSFWWMVCSPSTELLADGRSANNQGTGGWTYPFNDQVTSKSLYGLADVGPSVGSNRTDLRSYALFIR